MKSNQSNQLANHLKDRHIDFDLHRPVIDEEQTVATFYLWTLSGVISGYQQYRPDQNKDRKNNPKDSRYYTYRKYPSFALFGVESLHLKKDIVFLTEGLFDAARLTERGLPALAMLSNDPPRELHNWLFCLNRKIIAVCDNDAGGRALAKFGHVVENTIDKDLGDSSDEFITNFVYKYSKEN